MGRLAMVVLLLTAGVAVAQPRVPEGTRLFEEGRKLADQGKYDAACAKFQQSLEIDRAPGTALNYGDCLEHLGQLRRAFQMYDEASNRFQRDKDPRAKFARERANAVLPKLGTLVVKVADPAASGLIVELGRQSVPPQREITENYDPGDVAVTARVPGREPFTASARVVAGATVIIEIPAFVASTTLDSPPPRPPTDAVRAGGRNGQRVRIALGLGLGGGVVVGISGLLALTAKSKYDDVAESPSCTRIAGTLECTEEAANEINSAGTRADIATVVGIGGALLVTGAVVVYLTAPREAITVTPTASASTVGVTLSGRF